MSTLVAIVKSLVGQVFAVSLDGLKRQIFEGERLLMGEQVLTGLGGEVTLQLANGDLVNVAQNSNWQAAPSEAQAEDDKAEPSPGLEQALTAGFDPTVDLEAPAAGPGAGGGTGGAAGGGHSFVMLGETGQRLDPTIGFETAGLGFNASVADEDIAGEETTSADVTLPPETGAPTIGSVEPGAPGVADDNVNEGETLVFNVSITGTSTQPVSYALSLGGTATAGSDYTATLTNASFSNGVTYDPAT
ncbi:retention module-containing protein, partial [Pseudomonas sp. 8BK]|uniref:retention module-containing protein n=1 Tax=Pseudomonas sp. 8BK TaxID=2653164 RepID=UPI0035583FEC